jgi:hypothetical protein
MTTQPHEKKNDDHPQTGPNVTVSLNTTLTKTIHRGSHLVSELKTLLGVSADLMLSQDIDGTLTPLDDNGRVTIKGGEAFFSGPRTGGSSHA